jgi:hypothetical protein
MATIFSVEYTNDIQILMIESGCIESVIIEGKHRLKFKDHKAALKHRSQYGCGGWVLGPYVFAGCKWTPSSVVRNSKGVSGVLK